MVNRADRNVGAIISEEIVETSVVILIGVRNHNRFELSRLLKFWIAPPQESDEVVSFSCVDEDVLVVGSHNQAAIALSNVHKNNFKQAILLKGSVPDPTFIDVPGANRDPAIPGWTTYTDVVSPK